MMTIDEREEILLLKGSIRSTSLGDLKQFFDVDIVSHDNYYWRIKLNNPEQREVLVKFIEDAQKKLQSVRPVKGDCT